MLIKKVGTLHILEQRGEEIQPKHAQIRSYLQNHAQRP
jgi:hypothetical protein